MSINKQLIERCNEVVRKRIPQGTHKRWQAQTIREKITGNKNSEKQITHLSGGRLYKSEEMEQYQQ